MNKKQIKYIEVRCSMCNEKIASDKETKRFESMPPATRLKCPPIAQYVGNEPVCPACLNTCERVAKFERLRRQEKAMRRDRSTLRTMACAGIKCGRRLLGLSERFWFSSLPAAEQAKYEFAFIIIAGRPYCAACQEPITTDFAREAPHSLAAGSTLAEIEAALGE